MTEYRTRTRSPEISFQSEEIARSVGLENELTFPREDDGLVVAPCIEKAKSVLLTRVPAEAVPPDLSGWMLACTESHDHGDRDVIPLLAARTFFNGGLVQLLALPHGCSVHATWHVRLNTPEGWGRIEPRIFRNGAELQPKPGSYVHGLQTSGAM